MDDSPKSECKYAQICPFFNDKLAKMPSLTGLIKKQFCYDDYEKCARFLVRESLGADRTPADLYPNDFERAKRLVTLA